MVKTYFCGSIRGGREDAPLYHRMIEQLRQYGPVLTEHVGDPRLSVRGDDGTSAFIWKRDTDWLRECDVVVAECTQVSMGVGYELAFAEALGKPVYVFHRGDHSRLSAMVAGCPNFQMVFYEKEEELPERIREIYEKQDGERQTRQ